MENYNIIARQALFIIFAITSWLFCVLAQLSGGGGRCSAWTDAGLYFSAAGVAAAAIAIWCHANGEHSSFLLLANKIFVPTSLMLRHTINSCILSLLNNTRSFISYPCHLIIFLFFCQTNFIFFNICETSANGMDFIKRGRY
jgi:hypothetical protein